MLEKFTKVKDERWLKRYLRFIEIFSLEDEIAKESHNHHILPRSIYPEYSNLKTNVWNKAVLKTRAHLIAHYILAKALGGNMWFAYNNMNCHSVKLKSRLYEIGIKNMRIEMSLISKEWIKNNGHPRGMLGKKFTQEQLLTLSTSQRKYLDSLTVEQKEEKRLKLIETKTINGTLKHTEEAKRKMSEIKIGHEVTEQTISKIIETKRVRKEMGLYDFSWSEERKEEQSKNLKEYFKENNHHTKGKSYEDIMGEEKAKEVKEKRKRAASKQIIINDICYESKHEACISLNVSWYILNNMLNGIKGRNHIQTVTIDDITYKNKTEACKALNISLVRLNKLLKEQE